jgi:DNA modification methylase
MNGGGKSMQGHSGYFKADGTPLFNPKGRNKRSVWSISTKSYAGAHFAVFPEELVRTPILAGCPAGGIVLDPFMGSGTTLAVAAQEGRDGIGIELNAEYIELAHQRLAAAQLRIPTPQGTRSGVE